MLPPLRERAEDLMLGREVYPGMFFQLDAETGRYEDAPIGHCLYWLGQGDDGLAAVVWKQLDARISKAEAQQKATYADTVFKALEAKDLTIQNHKDCLELLGRIKHPESAKKLVDILLPMERELWPSAGRAFASKRTDGIAGAHAGRRRA